MPESKTIEPNQLCHYTSVDVLCKLFVGSKNKKLLFHASSVFFMNDSAEYMAALDCCRDFVTEIIMEKDLGMPFALSFSESENAIPMWNMYANDGKGVCLVFDFNQLKDYFESLQKSKKKGTNNSYKFSLCQYKEFKYNNVNEKPTSSSLNYPNTNERREKMTENAFIKPLSFNYEKEWRLMIWKEWPSSDKNKILFKVRNEELCPYLEIPIPVKCLKQIVLSPYASDQMVDSVRLLLANYAPRNPIRVDKSNITLKI
ncbi:MAG: DUF2971 domain-containing protein [Bacteroidaceae bacterium]|nr:DUF2971 domain-containing protein [Bacteroidaceae bacterium]